MNDIRDLLNCTFFDWDAILFDLQSRELIASQSYFSMLRSGVMDVNLEENPNPTGSLVRAIRRGWLWKVRFGPKLSSFVRRRLDQERWDALVALDESAFVRPVLRHCDPARLRTILDDEVIIGDRKITEPFGPPRVS